MLLQKPHALAEVFLHIPHNRDRQDDKCRQMPGGGDEHAWD